MFDDLNLPKCNRKCYRGYKQKSIPLKIHAEMFETILFRILFRTNVQFRLFIGKCQQVDLTDLNSASITVFTLLDLRDIDGCRARKLSTDMGPIWDPPKFKKKKKNTQTSKQTKHKSKQQNKTKQNKYFEKSRISS